MSLAFKRHSFMNKPSVKGRDDLAIISLKVKLALTAFLLDRLMLASILLCLHSDDFILFSFSFQLRPCTRHIHLCALFRTTDACYTPS